MYYIYIYYILYIYIIYYIYIYILCYIYIHRVKSYMLIKTEYTVIFICIYIDSLKRVFEQTEI